MNVIKATHDFERWLAKQIPLVRRDVALKHAHMAESPFAFFRATFYRWLQLWHANCADVAGAPKVLAVGDLHIENFGTWRDQEGRLIWGVNDLDEAWPGPYTLDLIRLTTSAYLAISGEHLGLEARSLGGDRRGLPRRAKRRRPGFYFGGTSPVAAADSA